MTQGDESPLFCRDDTPPRRGVPPGYVSIRSLILKPDQSVPSCPHHRSAVLEENAPHFISEQGVSPQEDNSTSNTLVNLNNNFEADAIDTASVATQSDSVQIPFPSPVQDQRVYQSDDEIEDPVQDEGQVHDSFSGSLEPPGQEREQISEVDQSQHGLIGGQSPLFCRENTPPRSGVPPGYQSLRSVMGSRARARLSLAGQGAPAVIEKPHESHAQPDRTAPPTPWPRHQSSSISMPTVSSSQPAPPRPLTQQQRPILPYVFAPSAVPQTPMESTLADPLVTRWEAQSGTAVYSKHSPITTTTSEGLYTLTDGQVYWNSRGRRQCFKLGCDNNHGIGYTTEQSRDEHISNSRFHKEVPHHGYEQTKRGYRRCHG